MKVLATMLYIFLALPLWCGGCSREESAPPPSPKNTVVVPIEKPLPEDAGRPLTDEEKFRDEAGEEQTAIAVGKPVAPPKAETTEMETGTRETGGHYTVKRGEGLSSIAARGEVYGDPLKWPILYRYNMGKIGELQLVENFLERALPEGVRLRIITPDEARENFRRRADHIFTVNVLSARTQKGLISSAIRLMREGYMVYITSAMVRGRQWMRLRVGFFKTKLEADLERKKINALLSIRNSWVTKVGKEELEEFGCY